jgi:hypothetical protein
MATITFDTHQFIRTLKDAGIPENQAEAITSAIKTAQSEQELVTKQDLTLAVKELEVNLTRWIIGAGFLQTALIAGLLLKLIK